MGKIGIIATIPLQEGGNSFESALAAAKMTRMPGTGRMMLPYREKTHEYRTGLDSSATYIKRILDPSARKFEQDRVDTDRKRFEELLKIPDGLGPRSDFYNISSWSPTGKNKLVVEPVKLMEGDNYFDLEDPMQAVTYAWLRVHPQVASSMERYKSGEFPEAKFYVKDDELEQEILYREKTELNKAKNTLDNLSLEKRRKVARQCALPVSEDDKEGTVYNMLDSFISQGLLKNGPFEGMHSVSIFNRYVTMQDEVLHVKDLIRQAIVHNIYREDPQGRFWEGKLKVADDESTLVSTLLDDKDQEPLLVLEDKLKAKKSMML